MATATHGEKAGEGKIGTQKRELCDCDNCTQQRIFYVEKLERGGKRLPYQNAPTSFKLQ